MNATEDYTPALNLTPGCTVMEADGFLLTVVRVEMSETGRCVLMTLKPVYGSMTWPEGEERTQKIGRNRMVRVQ